MGLFSKKRDAGELAEFHIPEGEHPEKTAERQYFCTMELARRGVGPREIARRLKTTHGTILRWLYD